MAIAPKKGLGVHREDIAHSTDSARASDDLQKKLQSLGAELERTKKERDYAFRLLRQQQTLSISRIQNHAYAHYMERDSRIAAILRRVPRGVKELLPLRFKQFLRSLLIKIRE